MSFAWQEKYREALLALSPDELQRRIEAARKAIEQRVEERARTGDTSGEEQQAIDDAIRGLRVLARTECQTQNPERSVVSPGESAS
jgi:hypothetical protein